MHFSFLPCSLLYLVAAMNDCPLAMLLCLGASKIWTKLSKNCKLNKHFFSYLWVSGCFGWHELGNCFGRPSEKHFTKALTHSGCARTQSCAHCRVIPCLEPQMLMPSWPSFPVCLEIDPQLHGVGWLRPLPVLDFFKQSTLCYFLLFAFPESKVMIGKIKQSNIFIDNS